MAFALTRVGDAGTRAAVASDIARLARSDQSSDRTLAAIMVGEVEPGEWMDRSVLRDLLADADPAVVDTTLAALRWPEDAELLGDVAAHLDDRQTAGAAVDALVRAGDAALVVVDDGLRGDEHGRHVQEMLVRAAREVGSSSAVTVLRRHIEHPDREVGLTVMRALAALGPSGPGGGTEPIPNTGTDGLGAADLTEGVVRIDLEHATHALRALVAFERGSATALLRAALRDELDLIRQRILAAFSMRHGTEGFDRVVFQLAQRDPHSHALALEWLDVTLLGTERSAVALLEPRLSDRDRLTALSRTFPLAAIGGREILLELVQDSDGRWRRPWVKACALYAASGTPEIELDAITAAAGAALVESPDDEDWIVLETLTALRPGGG